VPQKFFFHVSRHRLELHGITTKLLHFVAKSGDAFFLI
jgi:hypothetical protein